jgi:glycosyltransferase involved in cell wall biosynthesis
MRVTVICGMVPPCAAPEGVLAVMSCDQLAARGCEVTLLTANSASAGLPERWRSRLFEFRPSVRDWTWAGVPSLMRELKRSRPDSVLLIYIGYLYGRHPMITFLPSLCRLLKPRPRVVVEFSNVQGAEPSGMRTRAGRKLAEYLVGRRRINWRYGSLLRDSDAVVAYCAQHLHHLVDVEPSVATRSRVIPAAPALQIVEDRDGDVRRHVRAQLGAADHDFVLAYFGHLYPSKGIATLLESVALARKVSPRLRLLMIGGEVEAFADRAPNYARQMRALCTRLGLDEWVTWTGFCEDHVASAYLRAADACALPFVQGIRLNNSSYAVAAAHGLPVVTTRGESLEGEFVDRHNVLLCWASDAQDLADGITEVARDAALRRSLRAGSAEIARTRLSWQAATCDRMQLLGAADGHDLDSTTEREEVRDDPAGRDRLLVRMRPDARNASHAQGLLRRLMRTLHARVRRFVSKTAQN